MKLNELNSSTLQNAQKTLSEGLGSKFDVTALNKQQTIEMLRRVSGMISEAKASPAFHKSHKSRSYMKMAVLEQALWAHYSSFKPGKNTKIVVESEDIGQAQVVLAAKDMVDSIQKMIEQSSDMLVKELPAVVDSIRSQIGANEGKSFNDQASNTLRTLTDALMQAKTSMQQAMDALTGNASPAAFDAPEADLGANPEAGEEEMPADDDVDISSEFGQANDEPEETTPELGRERR